MIKNMTLNELADALMKEQPYTSGVVEIRNKLIYETRYNR